jgi:hypothetical protein
MYQKNELNCIKTRKVCAAKLDEMLLALDLCAGNDADVNGQTACTGTLGATQL